MQYSHTQLRYWLWHNFSHVFIYLQMHQIVQEEVLNQIINRTLTNAAGYVQHYIGKS